MHELLAPKFKDIAKVHAAEFAGMTREEIPLEVLCETRERLVSLINIGLDADEKRFLLSLMLREPEWDTLGIPHLRELPGLQWKLINIRRMDPRKRAEAQAKLLKVLGC